jgi:hypothetical protein
MFYYFDPHFFDKLDPIFIYINILELSICSDVDKIINMCLNMTVSDTVLYQSILFKIDTKIYEFHLSK